MNYDVKYSGNPIYEHLFPFYSDFCVQIIGYKLKNTVYKPSKVTIVDVSSKLENKSRQSSSNHMFS